MEKIGLFYGSTMGTAQSTAEQIKNEINSVEIYNVADGIDGMEKYNNLIFGTNTWGYGELQDDWAAVENKLNKIDFTGKKVAIYSTGDQESYEDTFVDAIGILYKIVKDKGGEVIGFTSKEGYKFKGSLAVINDKFAGLAIDELNQGDMTEKRVKDWAAALVAEFGEK